jgi:hypothetical protein
MHDSAVEDDSRKKAIAEAPVKLGKIWVKAMREWSAIATLTHSHPRCSFASAASIGTNNDVRDASQLLNIEVKQIAPAEHARSGSAAQPAPNRACGSNPGGGECG